MLNKYINWFEPMRAQIMNGKNAGHNVERSVGYFCIAEYIPVVPMTKSVEHIYACGHEQAYGSSTQQELIEMFLDGKLNKKSYIFKIDKESDIRHNILYFIFFMV